MSGLGTCGGLANLARARATLAAADSEMLPAGRNPVVRSLSRPELHNSTSAWRDDSWRTDRGIVQEPGL